MSRCPLVEYSWGSNGQGPGGGDAALSAARKPPVGRCFGGFTAAGIPANGNVISSHANVVPPSTSGNLRAPPPFRGLRSLRLRAGGGGSAGAPGRSGHPIQDLRVFMSFNRVRGVAARPNEVIFAKQ